MFVDFKQIDEMTERERFEELEIILCSARSIDNDKKMACIIERACELVDSLATTLDPCLLDYPGS